MATPGSRLRRDGSDPGPQKTPEQRQVEKAQRFAELVLDPAQFAQHILGHDIWPTSASILRAVRDHPAVAVKACHASSKSFTAAEAALWWVTRYSDGIVVTTAPTWNQVEKILWSEIHKAVVGAKVKYPDVMKTELRLGPGRYIVGLSTNEGVRFQGFHGRILVILDEAPGIRPDIYEAIEGIAAGGQVHKLALGNPTVVGGEFYDAFDKSRPTGWKTFSISAFDTPNFQKPDGTTYTTDDLLALPERELKSDPRPYLIRKAWVVDRYRDWGPLSPLYQSRVLGEFPEQSEASLFPIVFLEAASGKAPKDQGPVDVGIDVAGPGEDETVVYLRAGNSILRHKHYMVADPFEAVCDFLRPYLTRIRRINVDAVGIGFQFSQRLKEWVRTQTGAPSWQSPVYDFIAGAKAKDTEKFKNLKAEAYWTLRLRFQDGDVAGLADPTTLSQLSSMLYEHTPRGQVVVESKDDALKRGVKSPDRAEALMLAFYDPSPPGIIEYYKQEVERLRAERAAQGVP